MTLLIPVVCVFALAITQHIAITSLEEMVHRLEERMDRLEAGTRAALEEQKPNETGGW